MNKKNEIDIKLENDIDYENLLNISADEQIETELIKNAVSEGFATKAGIQTQSLQSAMNNYAKAMDLSAIAKSTGLPKRTPTPQYKGFAAEEYFKNTMKINALAKGVPDYKIGIYTQGHMPDGSVLSGIDMETDISVWTRKHFWSKPRRTVDYQSKIHNNPSDYAHDMNNPQYQDVQFVGGAGQGVNDTVKVKIDRQDITSDSITPKEAAKAADQMKAQTTPEYSKQQEKFNELNKVNLSRAVASGAVTGLLVTSVQEIVGIIKDSKNLSKDQFIESVSNILCGTIEGGVRGGAITGSVQLFGKMLGKEVLANSLEAVPVMAAANVAVDFAKDLYKCFVTQTIDADDLLCNSVNNIFYSSSSFGGAWVGGQAFVKGLELFNSAKIAAETGAAIGSSVGPIGTIVGSVIGGLIIGLGANAIIGTANKDAQTEFNKCIQEINSHIELSGCDKLYYFADSMANISEFRLSFKNLLPCYNLISDLREYNLHKKAIKNINQQLDNNVTKLDIEKKKALNLIETNHKKRIAELKLIFEQQKSTMFVDFKESVNTYVSNSYMQYIQTYDIIEQNINAMVEELQNKKEEHSYILDYMKHRNEINKELNQTLCDLLDDENKNLLEPIINKMIWFIQQDRLLVGRQYISYEQALSFVQGDDI